MLNTPLYVAYQVECFFHFTVLLADSKMFSSNVSKFLQKKMEVDRFFTSTAIFFKILINSGGYFTRFQQINF